MLVEGSTEFGRSFELLSCWGERRWRPSRGRLSLVVESMPHEIERKFLLKDRQILKTLEGEFFQQGYIETKDKTAVRVRVVGDEAFLTIKGENSGIRRLEFEYAIPREHASVMLKELCISPMIEKKRYRVKVGGLVWEIDEFLGENLGLYVAEIELESETQKFELPDWAGEEVSGQARYYNSQLVNNPFCNW